MEYNECFATLADANKAFHLKILKLGAEMVLVYVAHYTMYYAFSSSV